MTDVQSLISERFTQREDSFAKMDKLAKGSAYGDTASFSGLFKTTQLSDKERGFLRELLNEFKQEETFLEEDFNLLASITSEVKVIHNQAVILHGERIKKAQEILKRYQEGAFTQWLISTYGNRQTPYNFLQYYLFYETLPPQLKEKVTQMPKQAVYTLASRDGDIKLKHSLILGYEGETKNEILATIREHFPLQKEDKRGQNHSLFSITQLSRLMIAMSKKSFKPLPHEKETILALLEQLKEITARK